MTDLSSTLPASSLAGLMRELRQMAQQPIEGIQLQMNDNLMNLHAQIEGSVVIQSRRIECRMNLIPAL